MQSDQGFIGFCAPLFRSKVFLCRKVVDKSLLVLKQVPLDELQKDDRRAALNEVTVLSRWVLVEVMYMCPLVSHFKVDLGPAGCAASVAQLVIS